MVFCRAKRDDAIAGAGQLARNAEAEAAAAAGDENGACGFSHSAAPVCRSPRRRAPARIEIAAGTLWRGNAVAAELQYLVLDLQLAARRARRSAFSTTSAITIAPVTGLCFGRTSDMRTCGMPIDDRLDFFGMNLQAADIDDAAAAAGEDIAIAAPLHHVAGIDEAVVIAQAPPAAYRR